MSYKGLIALIQETLEIDAKKEKEKQAIEK